jgi:hypothetical protein
MRQGAVFTVTNGASILRSQAYLWVDAQAPETDIISEWKEEETVMDYATMNEFMDYLRELRAIKRAEFDEKVEEIDKIDSLINKIDSQYPKPEDEK